jgi:DNA (cytosine-5)-methyltransferase 1
VFVVGCLGDWRSAAKVLFESESLCRDITPSREKGQEVANCLTKSPSSYSSYNPARSEGNAVICSNVAPTISSSGPPYSRTGNSYVESEALVTHAFKVRGGCAGGGKGYLGSDELAFTLSTNQDQQIAVGFKETSDCLTAAFKYTMGAKAHGIGYAEQQSPTLDTNAQSNAVLTNMHVRRITPMECERLQGFPDNYTNIPTSSDATRYKALGNSMAVPVMKWIGKRINDLS